MNIVHITKGDRGGLDQITSEIIEHLNDFNKQRVFCLMSFGRSYYKNIDHFILNIIKCREEVLFVNFIPAFWSLVKADRIHVHHTKLWILFSPLFLFGRKTIYTFHMSYGSGINKNILTRVILFFLISYCVFFSKKLIFLTKGQLNEISKLTPFKKIIQKKSVIIPNFIDKSFAISERKITLNPRDNVGIFVGRPTRIKGYFDFIDTCKKISTEKFLAVGADFSISKDYPPNLSIQGVVNHKEITAYYDQCEILVLPSYTEAFPLVILEAMSRGLAVLVSDLPGMREIVSEDRNGFLFKPGDVEQIVKLIQKLLNDRSLLMRIQKNNLQDIKKYYKQDVLSVYRGIYE